MFLEGQKLQLLGVWLQHQGVQPRLSPAGLLGVHSAVTRKGKAEQLYFNLLDILLLPLFIAGKLSVALYYEVCEAISMSKV